MSAHAVVLALSLSTLLAPQIRAQGAETARATEDSQDERLEPVLGILEDIRARRFKKASVAYAKLLRKSKGFADTRQLDLEFLLAIAARAEKVDDRFEKGRYELVRESFGSHAELALLPILSSIRGGEAAQRAAKAGGKSLVRGLSVEDQVDFLGVLRERGQLELMKVALDELAEDEGGLAALHFLRGELYAQERFFDKDVAVRELKAFLAGKGSPQLDQILAREATRRVPKPATARFDTSVPEVLTAAQAARDYLATLATGEKIRGFDTTAIRQGALRDVRRLQQLREAILDERKRGDGRAMEPLLLEVLSERPYNPVGILSLADVYASDGKCFDRKLAQLCYERFDYLTTDEGFNEETVPAGFYTKRDFLEDFERATYGGQDRLAELRKTARARLRKVEDGKKLLVVSTARVIGKRITKLEKLLGKRQKEERKLVKYEKQLEVARQALRNPRLKGGNLGGAISHLKKSIKNCQKKIDKIDAEQPRLAKRIEELEVLRRERMR